MLKLYNDERDAKRRERYNEIKKEMERVDHTQEK